LVAKEIVRYSAEVMRSLYDDRGKDADSYIKNEILPCLFHPMFVSGSPGELPSKFSRQSFVSIYIAQISLYTLQSKPASKLV
jgi:hypothetical protein